MKFLVLNGPNLNLLGLREPDIYGKSSYRDLCRLIRQNAKKMDIHVRIRQTNHEGRLVEAIQRAYKRYDGIIINPAAYTHTSVAIADAVKAVMIPTVEVHISDVSAREDFRQISYIRPCCIATVSGMGFEGYIEAMRILTKNRK